MKEFDFEKVPIVEIANEILLDGVKKGASDIHFDPSKDCLKVRMRVDGILYDYSTVPAEYKKNIVSRIKMIASMNIMETRLPQDGAIKSKIGDKILDLRVSSLPTNCGEKVVLRILDYSRSSQGLESLGFSESNYKKIMKMISIPNGIVLVTGATGSGKSTTVYSILQKLNTRDVNILTVEDPVEMDVEGINQVQAQSEIGLDFANVLRSMLRQDPDIIMVGEIRDNETAKIAVRASITGHKVLSTIHTNNALNTIERLTDMDVERYLIGTSLNGAIAQKLTRKLCPYCRIVRDTTDYEKDIFKRILHKRYDKTYDANEKGCEHCFRGYKDRLAIAEVLLITDEIRTAITNAESKEVLRNLVYSKGNTQTILEDGLEKITRGETTFDEIIKLADLESDLAIHKANDIEKGIKETDYDNMPLAEIAPNIKPTSIPTATIIPATSTTTIDQSQAKPVSSTVTPTQAQTTPVVPVQRTQNVSVQNIPTANIPIQNNGVATQAGTPTPQTQEIKINTPIQTNVTDVNSILTPPTEAVKPVNIVPSTNNAMDKLFE